MLQFQFQFFTLKLKNSDKTKSRGVDCDITIPQYWFNKIQQHTQGKPRLN